MRHISMTPPTADPHYYEWRRRRLAHEIKLASLRMQEGMLREQMKARDEQHELRSLVGEAFRRKRQ